MLVLAFPAGGIAAIRGDVVSAGFDVHGPNFNGRVVRLGVWTPVVVQLALEGQVQFNGKLRIRQADRDGDVCYDYADVLLNADSIATRRYTLYALPTVGPDGGVNIEVELVNEDGDVVRMLCDGQVMRSLHPRSAPEVLADDQDLIVGVSAVQSKITRLGNAPVQTIHPLRRINVACIEPDKIPERWQGLEAVDCIVWDDADPDAINNAQRRALAEWTRQGGQLVLATARHAAALQQSDVFGPMLPVKVGSLTTLKEAALLRRAWVELPDEEGPEYDVPIPLAECSLRQGPGIRRTFPPPGSGDDLGIDTLIARRRTGRGTVVFVAATLRDLIDNKRDPSEFLHTVLETRTTSIPEAGTDRTLYEYLEIKIGFAAVGSLFMVLAMLFVMAYVGLSTFGAWGLLKARGWAQHNWTVFAAVAAAASVVGISAAQYARGIGRQLNQLTVVDATAGTRQARATAYFGLKTGTHSILDVWLAENYAQKPEPHPTDCFLRPLPARRALGESRRSFADQRTYDLRPATAELLRVPVRATLKQFEGRWRGELRGSVDAPVRIIKQTFVKSEKDQDNAVQAFCFQRGSRITNNLGVDLENCYVFQPTANRYSKTNCNSPRSGFLPGTEIMVHRLGPPNTSAILRNGETFELDSLYHNASGDRLTWEQWHHSLMDWQNQWGKFAKSMLAGQSGDKPMNVTAERYQESLLLLTALSEYDEINTGIKGGYTKEAILFSRERCRTLDLSDVLTEDVVLLVGFARDAGQVTLCTRRSGSDREYKRLIPDEAWTMYRIVIPVLNR